MSSVIDIEEARARLRGFSEHEAVDIHDVALDISDVVYTSNDIDYNVEVTEDYIIIHTNKEDEEST